MGSLILNQTTVTYMVAIFGYLYMLVTIPPTKLCPIWFHIGSMIFLWLNTSHMATYGRVWLHINSVRMWFRNAGSEMQVRECRLGNAGTGIKVLTIQNIRVEYRHHRMRHVTAARRMNLLLENTNNCINRASVVRSFWSSNPVYTPSKFDKFIPSRWAHGKGPLQPYVAFQVRRTLQRAACSIICI